MNFYKIIKLDNHIHESEKNKKQLQQIQNYSVHIFMFYNITNWFLELSEHKYI